MHGMVFECDLIPREAEIWGHAFSGGSRRMNPSPDLASNGRVPESGFEDSPARELLPSTRIASCPRVAVESKDDHGPLESVTVTSTDAFNPRNSATTWVLPTRFAWNEPAPPPSRTEFGVRNVSGF